MDIHLGYPLSLDPLSHVLLPRAQLARLHGIALACLAESVLILSNCAALAFFTHNDLP